ncbi:MAG: DUF4192 family protein [Ancrocorticia sp.]|uniref:DUF4192 family protein n=1 Tax=Ancrocorticia sp. TaxID=2593684 RepID=UPI003F9222FC
MDTLTLHEPSEALVLIPHFIGFKPTHHLVFLGLEFCGQDALGERGAIGPVMVLDTDDCGIEPEAGIALARSIRDYGVRKAIMALFCGDINEDYPDFAREFRNVCAMVSDAMPNSPESFFAPFVVDNEFWAEYDGGELTPESWADLESSPVGTAMVYAGSAPQTEPPSHALERRGIDDQNGAQKSGAQWVKANRQQLVKEGARVWDELITRWKDPATREEVARDIEALGKANAALSVVGIRDRILMWSTTLDCQSISGIGEDGLVEGLSAAVVTPPPVSRLEEIVSLLELCATVACEDDPVALSCAGYCLWWFGQNTRAACRLEEALAADPDYTLAQLLTDAVNAAILPLWLSGTRGE